MMIFYVFIFTLIANNCLAGVPNDENLVIQPRGVSDRIRVILENLRDQMKCGFPEQNIPRLAPFEREYEEIEIKQSFVSVNASVANLRIDGADDFIIHNCDFSILTLKFELDATMKKLHVSQGEYQLKSLIAEEIGGLEFTGEGDLDFSLENLGVNLEMKLGVGLCGLYLKDMKIIMRVEKCNSNISGLAGGGMQSDLINKIIDQVCVDLVKHHEAEISQQIFDLIAPSVDQLLKDVTIKDIIGWITGLWKQKDVPTCQKY